MKNTLNLFKRIAMWIFGIIILLVIGVAIFVNTAPQFGQAPSGKHLEEIKNSPNYKDNKFVNLIETKMGSFSDMMKTLPDFLFGKNLSPKDTLPVKYAHSYNIEADSLCYITWYGHSSFLIETE